MKHDAILTVIIYFSRRLARIFVYSSSLQVQIFVKMIKNLSAYLVQDVLQELNGRRKVNR